MPLQRPTRPDIQQLIRLAAPIVAVQVGLMLMGVVDTAMVGRHAAETLAAAAIANVYFFAVSTLGTGAILALDPIIAQAHGAGDTPAIARGMQRGFLIAGLVTLPITAGLAFVEPVLRWAGQPESVIPLAGQYMRLILPGVLPYFAFLVFRQTLQALDLVRPLVLVILAANLLNGLLNWSLIFGRLGFPELGIAGAAVSTTLSRWAMLVGIAAATWRSVSHHLLPWDRASLAPGPIFRMLKIGLPIGLQVTLEYGVFGLVGLLMGRIGAIAIAGHQIALNLAALTFMVPLGIGASAAVVVGRAVGAGDGPRARRMASASIALGAGFMVVTALAFVSAPMLFGRAYTDDRAVLAVAASLIPLAGLFQVFDGTQAVALGVLRGAGDTRIPVLINLLGYWMLGVPVSLWLGFGLGLGPPGLWWGLVVGLFVVAVVLVWRVRRTLARRIDRLDVDVSLASVRPLE